MCPLCESKHWRELERISYDAIFDSLESEWGAKIPLQVRERHTPAESAVLVACLDCGLEFFPDCVPGDKQFYDQLTASPHYYEGDRWEFEVVAGRVARGEALVDFGSGKANFLLKLPQAGRRVGVDHSPTALDHLRGAGIEVFDQDFADFAESHQGAFDVATGFHIVEHLSDVGGFVGSALLCLKPGGRLFISVPNRERFDRPRFEALDCPPHHISRWSEEQLRWMAENFEIRLEQIAFEPPQFGVYEEALRDKLRPMPKWGRRALGKVMRASGATKRRYGRLRGSCAFEQRGILGFAMVAEYVKGA